MALDPKMEAGLGSTRLQIAADMLNSRIAGNPVGLGGRPSIFNGDGTVMTQAQIVTATGLTAARPRRTDAELSRRMMAATLAVLEAEQHQKVTQVIKAATKPRLHMRLLADGREIIRLSTAFCSGHPGIYLSHQIFVFL